jgi:Domain of unknown function (DUF4136)
MKTRITLTSLLVLGSTLLAAPHVALAGQQPKYGVTVQASKPEALAKARTYGWTLSQPSPNKTVDALIVAAVDRELQARGLTKAASGPADVVVTYGALRRTDANLNVEAPAGKLPEFAVGTLVVELSDAAKTRLFRVRMDKPIDTEPAKAEATINAAVAEMFAKYPGAAKR